MSLNQSKVEESHDLRNLFQSLITLIKHQDVQIIQTNQYHFTALGSLIPVLALLITIHTHWLAFVGIMCLAVALAVHWGTINTKLTLEKLCWIRLARQLEEQAFLDGYGPFTTQQSFFADLNNQKVKRKDRVLLGQIGLTKMSLIPIALLTAAILIVVSVGIVGRIDTSSAKPLDAKSDVEAKP